MDNLVERWIDELGYDSVPGVIVRRSGGCDADLPFAPEMRAMFDASRGIVASAFACVDRVPTVALVDRLTLPRDEAASRVELRAFCERLWNQNLTRVVLVAEEKSFEAWSVDNPQIIPERIAGDRRKDIEAWSLSGLLGGEVLRSRGNWFNPEKRVDSTLLNSIQGLVTELRQARIVHPALARELIARTIFVAYLEDRRIVSDDYRAEHAVGDLYALLGSRNSSGLDKLFAQLQADFNGDFLRSGKPHDAIWSDIPVEAFDLLHRFLGRTVLRSGQGDFWRYDFAEIPIELIAGIYETFLASKDQDDEVELEQTADTRVDPAARAKRRQGAYYTPRLLAEAVVDMALDGRDIIAQTIFDGACGSGMLLTAAFRRLIRHRQAEAERLGLDEAAHGFVARCEILRNQIFGADIDEDACRLTSFSLYLALLSDLSPRDLAVLRAGGHKLPHLSANIRRGAVDGDFFSEASEEHHRARYSVFLSNPPWRQMRESDAATQSVLQWVKRYRDPKPHLPKNEIAAAFTLAAADCLRAGGRAAVILPLNLFLSVERTRREFRGDLLARFQIERIVNFADMRYLLFADARHPFVVLIAEARDVHERAPEIMGETFAYQTPKADIALVFGRLSLHDTDAVRLPASALVDTTPHLGIRYWGNEQDIAILRRLRAMGRVGDLLGLEENWVAGKGFHLRDEDRRRAREKWSVEAPPWMRRRPFLDAKKLTRDLPVLLPRMLAPFPYATIARAPAEARLFSGPRVLWPDGTNPAKGINAIYTDTGFSFQHSLGVLAAPDNEMGRLTARFLAAYMRSTLGSWLSILMSASVSAERAKLHQAELFEWPFLTIANHPAPDHAKAVLLEVDELMRSLEQAPELLAPGMYETFKPRLNELVFDYFGLRREERIYVDELATIIASSIQPAGLGHRSMIKPLRAPPTEERLKNYCDRLVAEFRRWRDATGGIGDVRATTWTARRVPLGAAIIELSDGDGQPPEPRVADDKILAEIAEALARVTERSGTPLLAVPNLTILDGTRILIVKPLITRYWLQRAAHGDASRIALELQALSDAPDNAGIGPLQTSRTPA